MQSRSPPRDSESHLPISPEIAVQQGRGVQPPPSKDQLMRGQQQGRTLGCPLCEDIRHGKSSPPQISSMAPGSPSLQSPQSSPFPPTCFARSSPGVARGGSTHPRAAGAGVPHAPVASLHHVGPPLQMSFVQDQDRLLEAALPSWGGRALEPPSQPGAALE